MPKNEEGKVSAQPLDKTPRAFKKIWSKVKITPGQKINKPNSGVSTMQDDLANLITAKNKKVKKPRKRMQDAASRDVQRKLAEVYTDGDGEIPDLTKLDKTERPWWKNGLYISSVVLFILLVAAGAGFWIFSNTNGDNFTNEKVTLKIDTPITLVSGQESEYEITITNREKIDLYNAKLELVYPDNFQYINAEPVGTGEKHNIWTFTILESGETQRIKITGKLIATIDSVQTFRGALSFKPAGLNADFRQESIVDAVVASSIISLNVNGPDKTLANQEVEYVIDYQNMSEEDLTDLQLVVEYPPEFTFTQAVPEPNENNGHSMWQIDELSAEGSGEVKIGGNFGAASGGNYEVKARIQLKEGGDYYPQSEDLIVTKVIKDQLTMGLIINASAEDQPINFGDLLVYSLSFENTGQEDLEDIKIVANLDSQILDWGTLADDNNARWQGSSITWTGKEVPSLLKLGPGEKGELSWTIMVEDSDIINDDDISKFGVDSQVIATVEQKGEISGEVTIMTKVISNSINSDLSLAAKARYYNDLNIPLGSGPIEPEVGQKSSYNVRIEISNNLHDVKDIMVVATLPPQARLGDKKSHTVGDLIFNQQAKKVTWNIARLPKSTSNTEATFNVEIDPTDEDLGRVLILISEINLTAKDADTGADISKQLKAVTTSFDDPILGRVNGIVK